mgnify:CR=1 FL=1
MGRKHTPESIEKIRKANTGKKHTPEAIEKIRIASENRKHSAETKEYLSKIKKGKKLPPPSDETKRKISESLVGNQRTLGYKHSEESKEKMRVAHTGDKNYK